eukprot:4977075-Alexandrium_andersonii.AAC.1
MQVLFLRTLPGPDPAAGLPATGHIEHRDLVAAALEAPGRLLAHSRVAPRYLEHVSRLEPHVEALAGVA